MQSTLYQRMEPISDTRHQNGANRLIEVLEVESYRRTKCSGEGHVHLAMIVPCNSSLARALQVEESFLQWPHLEIETLSRDRGGNGV